MHYGCILPRVSMKNKLIATRQFFSSPAYELALLLASKVQSVRRVQIPAESFLLSFALISLGKA